MTSVLSNGDEPRDPERVGHALFRVLKSLVFRDDPAVEYGDMPLSQLRCLHLIGEHEGQKMNELSHRMEVKLPAASQIVDRLVKRGMVARHPDPVDRRVVRVELTPEARARVAEMKRKRDARLASTLNGLSACEIEKVIESLDLLARSAERLLVAEKGAPPQDDAETDRDLVTLRKRASFVKVTETAAVSPEAR